MLCEKKVDHPIKLGEKIYQLPDKVPGKIYEDETPLWVVTSGDKWQKHDYDYENDTLYVPFLSLFDSPEDASQLKAVRKRRVQEMVQKSIPESLAPFYNTSNIADEYEKYLEAIKFVPMSETQRLEKFIQRQDEIQQKFERERKQWFKKMLWMQLNHSELFNINHHNMYPTVLFEEMYLERKGAIGVQPNVEEQIKQSLDARIEKLKKEQQAKKCADAKQARRNATHKKALENSEPEQKLRKELGADLNDSALARRKKAGGSRRAYSTRPLRLARGPTGYPIEKDDGSLEMEDDPNAEPIQIRKRPEQATAWNMLCSGQSWRRKKEEEGGGGGEEGE